MLRHPGHRNTGREAVLGLGGGQPAAGDHADEPLGDPGQRRTVGGVVGEHLGDQRPKFRRQTLQVGWCVRVGDPERDRLPTRPGVGVVAGGGVEQDGAQRVDVGGPVQMVLPPGLLGRHAQHGTDDDAARGQDGPPFGEHRETEVDHLWAVGGEEDVLRLEVAVQQTGLVHGAEPLRQQGAQTRRLHQGQRPVFGDERAQVGAGDVLHREPRWIGVGVRRDEGRDERAVHRLQAVDLEEEPGPALLVQHRRLDHFDGDLEPRRGLTQVDPAHAAGTEPTHEGVPADGLRVVVSQRLHRCGPPCVVTVA